MENQIEAIEKLLSSGEVKKADVAISKLLRSPLSSQEQSRILLFRARVRLLSARPEDALDDLNLLGDGFLNDYAKVSVVELKADCYFARFELASVGFAQRGDITQAEQLYREIIQNHENYENLGWAYYQLGRVHVALNEIDRAIEYFQEALLKPAHFKPLTSYCYERLGFIAYYEQRDTDKALSFLSRAIDTYPARENASWIIQVHLLQGRIAKGIRDYEQAWKAVETALDYSRKESSEDKGASLEALLMAGEILSEMGNRDKEVIGYLQDFIQSSKKPLGVDVTWSRVNELLGNAHFNIAQYEQAVAAYHQALQLNPDHPWGLNLQYRIARSYYQHKDYGRAVKSIEHLLNEAEAEEEVVDDYRVYDLLGNALFALRKYDQAIAAYQAALQIAPSNANNLDKIKSYHDLAQELI